MVAASPVSRIRVVVSSLTSLLLFSSALLQSGCPGTPPKPTETKTTSTKKSSANSAICVDSFERAVGMVQPSKLGVDSDPKTAITLINEWVTYCAPNDEIDVQLSAVSQKYLSDATWQIAKSRMENEMFDLRDVRYMRDAYLFRQIGEKLAKQADNDLARVNGFFDYVCTNIALDPSLTGTTPHTAFEALLWGLGSPSDRAWAFLGILQQMKMDGVIFTFDDVQLQAYQQPYTLVGVPIEGKIYLYDPLIGIPLPANVELADAAKWGQATWTEFKSDEFWKAYEQAKLPHGLLGKNPTNAKAWLYGTSSGWSSRIQKFESLLRGDQVVRLFNPLVDIPGKTSLLAQGLPQRVVAGIPAGLLPEFSGVWSYPETMINTLTSPTNEQQQQFDARMQPFQTASLVVKSSTSQQTGSEDGQHRENQMERSESAELKYYAARMSQLQQNFEICIPAYVKLSLNIPRSISRREDVIQMIMAQDANYWLGLTQFETEDYTVSADSLRRYLDQFGRQGRWFQPALINYCKALAAAGMKTEALEFINQVTLDSPQVQEAIYLRRRWAPPEESTPEAKPGSAQPDAKPVEPANQEAPAASTPMATPTASPAEPAPSTSDAPTTTAGETTTPPATEPAPATSSDSGDR